ncbi:MAG: DinB family protein [Longimicrobiales bacterium]
MPAYSSLLEEALEAWSYTRDGVLAELRGIPEESYDWQPTAPSRTVAELARHILESGLLMAGELTRDDGDFTRQSYTDHIAEHAPDSDAVQGKDALLEALVATHAEADARFRELGELRMLQYIRRFDGQRGTRLAWLYHGVEHESYHRGQLAVYARMLGIVPALTRQIYGGDGG